MAIPIKTSYLENNSIILVGFVNPSRNSQSAIISLKNKFSQENMAGQITSLDLSRTNLSQKMCSSKTVERMKSHLDGQVLFDTDGDTMQASAFGI